MKDKQQFKFSCCNGDSFDYQKYRDNNRYREEYSKSFDYIRWGNDNRLPVRLYDLYLDCGILQLIIDTMTRYVMGQGIEVNPSLKEFAKKVNADDESLDDILPNIISDYCIFNGFTLQGINSMNNKLGELYFNDLRSFRISGDKKVGFINFDWKNYSKKGEKLPLFDPNIKQPSFIYYYKGRIGRGYYPISSWHASILAVETQIKIQEFQHNMLKNDFTPSVHIGINNGIPSDEEKQALEESLKDSKTGVRKAGNILVTYADNTEQAPTINKIEGDNYIDKYNTVDQKSMNAIFAAFQCSPPLVGILNQTTGFSEQEFNELFKLWNNMTIKPVQSIIEGCMDELFQIENSVRFIPFPNTILD